MIVVLGASGDLAKKKTVSSSVLEHSQGSQLTGRAPVPRAFRSSQCCSKAAESRRTETLITV